MKWRRLAFAIGLALIPVPALAQNTIPVSSASWIVDGELSFGRFGVDTSRAGDVNGDGYDDVLIASAKDLFLYEGSAGGLQVVPSWSPGLSPSDNDNFRAFPAGDVNGDGFDDVVIGDLEYDTPPFYGVGRALLYLGSASGLAANPSWTVTGDREGVRLGSACGAGDTNGDGFSDVLLVAWDSVWVFHGSSSGLPASPSLVLSPSNLAGLFMYFPESDLAVEDMNADGYSDFAITTRESHGIERAFSSRLFLYRGSADGLQFSRAMSLDNSKGDLVPGVSPAGDVDGDGRADVAMIYYGGGINPEPGEGEPERIEVYSGSSQVLKHSARTLVDGIPSLSIRRTVPAGDLNGDGYADLAVAVFGTVQLYRGTPQGLGRVPAAIFEPEYPNSGLPFREGMGRAGDVNGDGYDDFMLSAPDFTSDQANQGRVYVFHGGPSYIRTRPGGLMPVPGGVDPG